MRNYTQIADSELLQLLGQEEDALAFGEIYNRYWDKLYPYFFLDEKVPKNQACEIHLAKNFSAAESR